MNYMDYPVYVTYTVALQHYYLAENKDIVK